MLLSLSIIEKSIPKENSKNVEEYVKLTERINCLVSYKELELLDGISGDNRSEKIRILLENYYNQ